MQRWFQKLLLFLRVHSAAAGLSVSDQAARLMRFDGKAWQMHAVRLEPGTLKEGRIADREGFIAALTALREQAQKKGRKGKMSVAVCFNSAETYTQVFALPAVEGKDLERAVELNLKMTSPFEADGAYSDWELVGRDENTLQLQILSAFIERGVVDGMAEAFFEAGFIITAVESRAFALARLLREKGAGIDMAKSFLFVNIDDSGLDFAIIRKGASYFEYAVPWQDLMNDKGEISIPKFEETLGASVRRVINFYYQHWAGSLDAIIFSAVVLEAETERVIAESASVPAARCMLTMGQPVSSAWFTALGCSLRESGFKVKDREINLLGNDLRDMFRGEELLGFMQFWRIAIPAALLLLVITFAGADIFLSETRATIESRSSFNLGSAQVAETAALQATASDFNGSVALVAAALNAAGPKGVILKKILDIAGSNQVTVSHVAFQSTGAPIALSGNARTQDAILAFETALKSDPDFSSVNLPLGQVQTNGLTTSFSMTFSYTR
ncbi:MAG: pilus assembly protein PilM [Minisyncoccia bacterium]|jgi:Tfp pilus assembly PilM family ATPase